MRAAALALTVLLLTTGCLGIGGEDEAETDAPTDEGSDAGTDGSSDDGTDGAPNSTSDHEHQPEPERHWDNKTGEVSGTNVVVESQGEAAEETTEVPEAANELSITLSAEQGEIDAEVYPPGCEEQDDEPGEDCSASLSTMESDQEATQPDGGNATFSTQDPDAGTWTIRMWKADAGDGSVPYTLEIWYLEEHAPGPDHHS
jgi:hypothetical protein